MNGFIIVSQEKKHFRLPVKIFHKVTNLRPLLNETSWKIFSELIKKEAYPSEIAKSLGLHEQKAYYYINQLKKAGLIEVQKTEERQGALAKYYKAKFESFALIPKLEELNQKEFYFSDARVKEVDEEITEFLNPFIHKGKLNAKIVVGSPDPHGPMKARARDAHFAVEVATFLGTLASSFKYPLILLDTMVESLSKINENLVIVGGPITNKLTMELNKKLKVKFVSNGGPHFIHSSVSKKDYTEASFGFVQKTQHPFFKNKKILLIAGNRNAGTQAAVIALIKNLQDIVKGNLFDRELQAKIVEGLDLDGDGQIDNVEIRE